MQSQNLSKILSYTINQCYKYLPLFAIVSLISSAFITTFMITGSQFSNTQVKADARSGAPFNVELANVSKNAVLLSFHTKEAGDACVYLGKDPLELSAKHCSSLVSSSFHMINIDNLEPGNSYFFKICTNSQCEGTDSKDFYGLLDLTKGWEDLNIVQQGFTFSFTTK